MVLITWFLNLPLDEYIDNTNAQSLNFKSKTTWSTTRRPKAKEKLKKVIYKKEKQQNQQMARKMSNQRNSKEKLKLKTIP
jgi:hypothetical protein